MSGYMQHYMWETTNTSSRWPTLTGAVDSSNKDYRTSTGWKAGITPIVLLNGKFQIEGVDYVLKWSLIGTITMTLAPTTGVDEVTIGFIAIA